MKDKQFRKQKFDQCAYEELVEGMFQGIGNLSRYIKACGLTEESIIESCEQNEDWADVLLRLLEIGDHADDELQDAEPKKRASGRKKATRK
jgi:hypothetical protein